MNDILILIIISIVGLFCYFIPTFKANSVDHPDARAILVLNLLLGWLLIPWVIALVWAYKSIPGDERNRVIERGGNNEQSAYDKEAVMRLQAKSHAVKSCPFCAEEIKAEAIKCKHCQSDLSTA